MSEEPPARGDESLAARFTPQMNAATSRFGVLSDIPFAFAVVAVLVVALVLVHRVVPSLGLPILGPIAAAPLVICGIAHVLLRGARQQVVAWLGTVPFAIDNLNAVLSGSGEHFEIHFESTAPDRGFVTAQLETACPEAFVIDTDEQRNIVSARFGIDDSKYNPLGAAHKRYQRMRHLIDGPLSEMHRTHVIKLVRFV